MKTPARTAPAEHGRHANLPARLHVLVLDEYFPYPPNSGKPIRSWNLLQRLATRHDITFLCHGLPSAEQMASASNAGIQIESVDAISPESGVTLYAKLLLNLFSPYPYSVAKHYTARFRDRLSGLMANTNFDLLHCEWTPYARYVSQGARVPILIATHNIESQIWARRAEYSGNYLARLFLRFQAAKMRRFERHVLFNATAVTVVSDADAQHARAWGARVAQVVDNGVDLEHFSPRGDGDSRRAAFVGTLDWFPNVDAVHFFVGEILPRLARVAPDIRTCIVGRNAPQSLKLALSEKSGIDFAGEVPDTRLYLAEAGMVIVPLRIGGGSRLKILEALAMGKVVISTTVGAEGLHVTDRKNIVLADTPDAFARAMVEVASSPAFRQELGAQGRLLVERQYGWDALSLKAEQAWLDTAARTAQP